MNFLRILEISRLWLISAALLAGCHAAERPVQHLREDEIQHYRDVATQVEIPVIADDYGRETMFSQPPRRIRHPREEDEVWDLTLEEVLRIAMANSQVIRGRAQFLSPANPLLVSPDQAPSVFDPAIQESNVFFGTRGVEAALSDFDTRFTTTMLWGRNESIQNSLFQSGGLNPGEELKDETGNFSARLEKTFAQGGTFAVNHNWNYAGNNIPNRLFVSTFTGLLQAEFRQPLLAGFGTEFTRIFGPIGQNLQGVPGTNPGVVIARINNDISIADFETNVRNLLKDAEDLYWDLVLAYLVFDAEVSSRNKTEEIWRNVEAKAKQGLPGGGATDETQARDNYFGNKARAANALADLYLIESQLRRLLGLPVNEGFIIRPSDDPITSEFLPDWYVSLVEGTTHRVELRRQKWNIKSLELQLKAARSLLRPRLDFVSNYRVNGFGDQLFSNSDNDGITQQGFRSAYETLSQGGQTGWNLGFEFSMPLGFRTAHAQVRNLELRLAKARTILAEQEHEISHELSNAFQQLDRSYATAEDNLNRQQAARERVNAFEALYEAGQTTVDPILRAQISLVQGQVAYARSLIEYNKAITELHFRKGTLLQQNNVFLAEGAWDDQAYRFALRQVLTRSRGLDAKLLHTEPLEFVAPGVVEDVVPGLPVWHPLGKPAEIDQANLLVPELTSTEGDVPSQQTSPTSPVEYHVLPLP